METHQKKSVLSINKAIALLVGHFKNKTPVFKFSGNINHHSYNKCQQAEKTLAAFLVFWFGRRYL